MTEPMTVEQLAAIEVRVSSATPGPWFTDDRNDGEIWAGEENPGCAKAGDIHVADVFPVADLMEYYHASEVNDPWLANANFIAHAREDIPALLAEVDRLRAQLLRCHDKMAAGIFVPSWQDV